MPEIDLEPISTMLLLNSDRCYGNGCRSEHPFRIAGQALLRPDITHAEALAILTKCFREVLNNCGDC
jgi:hypothetical protein